jgi:hypothetical protein
LSQHHDTREFKASSNQQENESGDGREFHHGDAMARMNSAVLDSHRFERHEWILLFGQ